MDVLLSVKLRLSQESRFIHKTGLYTQQPGGNSSFTMLSSLYLQILTLGMQGVLGANSAEWPQP